MCKLGVMLFCIFFIRMACSTIPEITCFCGHHSYSVSYGEACRYTVLPLSTPFVSFPLLPVGPPQRAGYSDELFPAVCVLQSQRLAPDRFRDERDWSDRCGATRGLRVPNVHQSPSGE